MRQSVLIYSLVVVTAIVGIGVFQFFYHKVLPDSMGNYEYSDTVMNAAELYKEKPMIYGVEKKMVVDIGTSVEELNRQVLENVTAQDYEGNDITEKIVVYRLKNVNLEKRGNYVINYSVTDHDGITATMDRYVIVE